MRKDLKMLPKVLKKNICCKLGLGLGFLAFFVLTCFFIKPLAIALAPGGFAAFTLSDAIIMMIRCSDKNYVVVSGVCTELHESWLCRRLKGFTIDTQNGLVRVITKIKMRTVKVGDLVNVYVPYNASVYDYKGETVVSDFYGIEVTK